MTSDGAAGTSPLGRSPALDVRTAAGSRPWWVWAAAAAAAVIVTRLAIIAALYRLTGGAEFTDDTGMHLALADDPLLLISGNTAVHGQHPPLLPIMEWLLLAPFRWLPDMVAIRLAYVMVEAGAVGATVLALRPTQDHAKAALPHPITHRNVFAIVVVLILSPLLWMTSAVMAQDEVIAAAVLACALALWRSGRQIPAVAVLGIGVGGAKVFLVLPLVALVMLGPTAGRGRRAAVGAAVTTVPYVAAGLSALARGNPLPLTGFDPNPTFGMNPWVFAFGDAGVSLGWAKVGSTVLASAATLSLVFLLRRTRSDRFGTTTGSPVPVIASTIAAMFLVFFVTFYHATPEYLALAVPAIALVPWRPVHHLGAHAALSIAWAGNLFFGVANAKLSGAAEKASFVRLYDRIVPVEPLLLHRASIVAWTVSAVVVIVALMRTASRHVATPDAGQEIGG